MHEYDEYDDPHCEYLQRLWRDEEKEPHQRFRLPPRRRQFRYWASHLFRPVRDAP